MLRFVWKRKYLVDTYDNLCRSVGRLSSSRQEVANPKNQNHLPSSSSFTVVSRHHRWWCCCWERHNNNVIKGEGWARLFVLLKDRVSCVGGSAEEIIYSRRTSHRRRRRCCCWTMPHILIFTISRPFGQFHPLAIATFRFFRNPRSPHQSWFGPRV